MIHISILLLLSLRVYSGALSSATSDVVDCLSARWKFANPSLRSCLWIYQCMIIFGKSSINIAKASRIHAPRKHRKIMLNTDKRWRGLPYPNLNIIDQIIQRRANTIHWADNNKVAGEWKSARSAQSSSPQPTRCSMKITCTKKATTKNCWIDSTNQLLSKAWYITINMHRLCTSLSPIGLIRICFL